MRRKEPLTYRTPPAVPRIALTNWEQARDPLERFLNALVDRYEALPAPHASTHMGRDDDITGSILPSPIVPGEEGDIGDGKEGFAPIFHVHDTTALGSLASVDPDIETFNDDDLVLIHAPTLFKLLQEILFKLEQLEAQQFSG